ncbi:MAG TPA: lipid A deacylase LpxR family protein [Candidatus Polarisedimenticolia bacterium]|nr:lipid A deacylase LpxR family protein [Candidatus Polarisedimenticolia bacterium]
MTNEQRWPRTDPSDVTRTADEPGARSAWRIATSGLIAAVCLVIAAVPPVDAAEKTAAGGVDAHAEKTPKSIVDRKMFRLEFDNDIFFGSDDAFSAGWSFQLHSRMMDQWNPGFAGWIGKVPGLGDDGHGGRVVRFAVTLSQIMVTPNDITIEAPQPNDAPWAGLLGATGTWSSYDNRRLAALQVYLGCMGPCSQVEDVQKFVHNQLGAGDDPVGWGNQLSNQALGNVNYEYKYKVFEAAPERHAFHRFANDFAVGGQVGAGTLDTFVRGSLEYRFGWGMPMGFTKVPDPPGIGTVLDPVYFDPKQPVPDTAHWSYVFNVIVRGAWIGYLAPAEGGETESGYNHPELDAPGTFEALAGFHVVRVPFGFHLTFFHNLNDPDPDIESSMDWANFSFEYRF